jgi:hypothetical protein
MLLSGEPDIIIAQGELLHEVVKRFALAKVGQHFNHLGN